MMRRHKEHATTSSSKRKYIAPILLMIGILTICSGFTLAYLIDTESAIINKFKASQFEIDLEETFPTEDNMGSTKSNVKVTNTGDDDIYVRINMVLQVVDEDGNVVATSSVFDADGKLINQPISIMNNFDFKGLNTEDWFSVGDVYYYKKAVPSGEATDLLFESMFQKPNIFLYDNVTVMEGKQKLQVTLMAEGIQGNGVTEAWGSDVTLSNGTLAAGGID